MPCRICLSICMVPACKQAAAGCTLQCIKQGSDTVCHVAARKGQGGFFS